MLVLPVGLSVVTDDPVGVCHRSTLGVSTGDLSVQSVVESLEETVSQVHVTNWVNALWEGDASWKLAVSVSPVVLDTLHVPLVHNNDDFLLWAFIDLSEEIVISLIDENLFEFWEEEIHGLNVPVDEI